MRLFSSAVLCLLFLSALACATTNRRRGVVEPERSHDLTHSEMAGAGYYRAFDAIRGLRPGELPATAPSGFLQLQHVIAVFVDHSVHDAGVPSLYELPVAGVCRILFLHGAEARLRYGRDRAIVVETVVQGPCD